MRVDLVSEHASPLATLGGVDAGGQNVHVAALAAALAQRGASVNVFTRRDAPDLPATVRFGPGVTVVHVDAGPARHVPKDDLLPFMAEFGHRLQQQWTARRPDVVHAHFWMSGLAAQEAARPLGIPMALTYHALGAVKRRQQGCHDTSPTKRLAIESWLARNSDLLLATTADEACELAELGAVPEHISVVPCGVDLEHFRPVGSRRPRSEPLGGRSAPLHRVVIVSRLVERKGIGNVIAAVAGLPTVELLIAGGPPADLLRTDPEALRFRELAAALGVADRVHLLGALDRESVPALLRSADVVACCPWYEPFGLVAVEAMACGVPVVASEVGGLAETVVDGVTGLHVTPRRPDVIAERLAVLLGDEALRRRMGAAGVRRARQYGWDRIAASTSAAYESLIDRRADESAQLEAESA